MVNSIHPKYRRLMEKTKSLFILESVESIVSWDMETMMPPKAVKLRSQQLALLSRMRHSMRTEPEIGRLLDQIEQNPEFKDLNQIQKRNVYLIRKDYEEQTKIPEKLVSEMARQQTITINTWKKAKKRRDFTIFKPELEKLVDLNKRYAEILRKVKQTSTVYSALIDIFEPNMTEETVARVFDKLTEGLRSLLKKCQNSHNRRDEQIRKYSIPTETQRRIAKALAEEVGFDISSQNSGGRIDETEHPFTNGYYDDVRITTHYYQDNFLSSIFSVLHEAGHALYEQNLRREYMYQPVGTDCSSGFHESQARFIENIIGRSKEFWVYFLPKLKEIAGSSTKYLEWEPFVYAINKVTPSKIRIEADEITYCLHIAIRFQIERELFGDEIKVDELPEVWNQKYQEYLGVTVQNDSEGVMQDTHWASGYYGYFPSYALGNIYSGQLLSTMKKKIPDWPNQLAHGEFHTIKRWLNESVHSYGNLYDPMELIKRITGKEMDVNPYLDYLKEKYSELYGF